MSEMSRRKFAMVTAAGVCACCASAEAGQERGTESEVPATQPESPTIDVGTVTDFAHEGIFDRFQQPRKVLVYRQGERLYASTAQCSHKRCTLMVIDATALKCPCHGSAFDINGVPVNGPATVALFRIGISISNGRVVVDPRQQFAEADWEQPGAFIDLPKPASP